MRCFMALVLALTLSLMGCAEDTCAAGCRGALASLEVSLGPVVSSTYDVDLVLDGASGAFTCEWSGLYSEWTGPTNQTGTAQTVVRCSGSEILINATPESVEISVTAQDGSWTGSVKESPDYRGGGPRCPGGSELCPPFAELTVWGVIDPVCAVTNAMCGSVPVDPIDPTCTLAAPPEEDGCDGTESVENPTTCTPADTLITVRVTQLQIDGDCDNGYDLDSCDGTTCIGGGIAPGEGIDGVDNAIAALGPALGGAGNNLGEMDQALHDGLCDGAIVIGFTIDANTEESCANVDLLDADGTVDRSIIMNFSDSSCLSGTVGTIPLTVGGVEGSLDNSLLRATVSNGGLSNGTLGGTMPEATATAILDLLVGRGSSIVAQVLDLNGDLSGDTANVCDAVSTTMTIGGVRD